MRLKKVDSEWWVIDGVYGLSPHGPYKTKDAAEEDKRGLERTIKSNPDIFKCVECGGTKQEEHKPGRFRRCRVCEKA
jgi:hypothetical protein